VASLRQRFKVSWNGGEPVEVTTTVKDLIVAVDNVTDGSSKNKVAIETSLIHAALARSPHKVPPYDEWLDQLDMYQELAEPNGLGPTQSAPLPTEPLPYRASPVPTGERGLDPTLPTLTTPGL
jgi:hypothetical protein